MASAWRWLAGVFAVGLVATSFTGSARAIENFVYEPPTREPKGELSRFVRENPDIVLEQVWAFVEQQGFTIESVNPQDHVLVARYSGDPRPFLDCGLVVAQNRRQARRTPAGIQRQSRAGTDLPQPQGPAGRPAARFCSSMRG